MVNTSKILTVSYGTFSCTLEGFDDSFDMMKAIAEYFRDLASDDRYFGAEPPTPDADMLARIAEREASRRVEARQERGAIVLRPSEETEPPAPTEIVAEEPPVETAPMPAPVAEEVAEVEELVEAEEEVQDLAEEIIEDPIAEIEEPVAEEVAAPAPQVEDDSVAAKLSRIRAVVSRNSEAEIEAPAVYSEDEHAEDFAGETAASIAAALHATADPEPEAYDEDTSDALDEFEEQFEAEEVVEDPQLAADIAAATAEEVPTPQHARVIRMKRRDFEAAVADGQLSEDDTQDAQAGLSQEDEDELLKELAEVEAELNLAANLPEDEDDTDALPSIFAEDEAEMEAPAPQAPAAPVGKAETDVGRLMDKAGEEMDRPEGAHRRSAIAHLRAAVQATRAETEAGGGLNRGDDSLHAYRDDLNSVVRPRRPRAAAQAASEGEPARRPTMKPAPLKLVAEQRVDAPSPEKSQVVRPRRVSLADVHEDVEPAALQDGSSNFVEFAENAGVKDLAELMEAAAAYMSYVEGRQKFSRPQLMNKARQVEEYQFSREDGLRSFGQLLRQGKIEKLKGGRFTVSDELIGFKPDNRAFG